MGNIKEVYIEAKKSKNYQTYTVGMTILVDNEEDGIATVKYYQEKCRELVEQELAKDNK